MRLGFGRHGRLTGGRPSRESWERIARRLRGPLYAAIDAGMAYQAGFGSSGTGRDMTVSVAIRHVRDGGGGLDIDTSDQPPWGDHRNTDWRLVTEWLHRAVPPDRVQFPLTLTADRWEQSVAVDGTPLVFVFVGGSTTWSALGVVAGRTVAVTGSNWPRDGLALTAIALKNVTADVPP